MLACSLGRHSLYPPAYSAFSFRALMETPPKMVSCDSKKQRILTRSSSQPWRMVSSHQLLKRKLSESWRLRGIKGGLQSSHLLTHQFNLQHNNPTTVYTDTPGSLEPKALEESPEYPSSW